MNFRYAMVAAAAVALPAVTASGTLIDLGLAGQYAAFASHHIDMTISSGNTLVTGNVAIGPAGSVDFSGGGIITGRLDRHPDATVNISGGSQVLGGVSPTDLSQADNDASAASLTARTRTPTQTIGDILDNFTITGNGGLNVINVDNLHLSSEALTLSGGANDIFIINVFGDFEMSGGSMIDLLGGLDASRILFNIVDPGSEVVLSGNSTLYGTLLATERNITVSGGYIEGAVIGCGDFLKLQSGPEVVFNGFMPIPAPSALALLAVAGLGRRRRRTA